MSTNDGHVMFCPKCHGFNEQNRGKQGPYTCWKCGTVWEVTYDIVKKEIKMMFYDVKQVIIHEGKEN